MEKITLNSFNNLIINSNKALCAVWFIFLIFQPAQMLFTWEHFSSLDPVQIAPDESADTIDKYLFHARGIQCVQPQKYLEYNYFIFDTINKWQSREILKQSRNIL